MRAGIVLQNLALGCRLAKLDHSCLVREAWSCCLGRKGRRPVPEPMTGARALTARRGAWLRSGPNHIAMSTALRATISAGLPLALLPKLGLGALSHTAVLGAIATSMVDVGGPYRTRLVAMLAQALAGSTLLLLGNATAGQWWIASVLMGLTAVASGLIRALGRGGASLGTHSAVVFLLGIQLSAVVAAGGAAQGVRRFAYNSVGGAANGKRNSSTQ